MAATVYAKAKYIRSSAQKARLVVDLIRGKAVNEAKDILKYTNKKAADDVLKVLESAEANATFNENLDKKNLVVVEAFVDDAPIFKRGRPVSRGRYHKILKRNCHITIGLSDQN